MHAAELEARYLSIAPPFQKIYRHSTSRVFLGAVISAPLYCCGRKLPWAEIPYNNCGPKLKTLSVSGCQFSAGVCWIVSPVSILEAIIVRLLGPIESPSRLSVCIVSSQNCTLRFCEPSCLLFLVLLTLIVAYDKDIIFKKIMIRLFCQSFSLASADACWFLGLYRMTPRLLACCYHRPLSCWQDRLWLY